MEACTYNTNSISLQQHYVIMAGTFYFSVWFY
jgi:hypothetical protein